MYREKCKSMVLIFFGQLVNFAITIAIKCFTTIERKKKMKTIYPIFLF